jgi:hypothetical protein
MNELRVWWVFIMRHYEVTMEHLSRDFRVVRLYRGRGFVCICACRQVT